MYVAKNTLRGADLGPKELASADPTVDVGPESAFFLRCAHKNARFGVKSYLLKRATPFLAKSVVDPPAARNRLARAVVDPRDRGGCVAAADMPA